MKRKKTKSNEKAKKRRKVFLSAVCGEKLASFFITLEMSHQLFKVNVCEKVNFADEREELKTLEAHDAWCEDAISPAI